MKHAYCIMAHGNWQQLQLLVTLIDDPRNDIYLHVDAKSVDDYIAMGGVSVCNSHLKLIKSEDVRWSDISQADVEVELFRAVCHSGEEYSRIHLISGVDLPIKSQDDIHDFFKDKQEEFIDVSAPSRFRRRIKYYHFFVRKRRKHRWAEIMRKVLILLQVPFINRLKKCPLQFAYGANWCSLTQRAVKEIVDKWVVYRPIFTHSTSCDELYKQMILLSAGNFKFAKEGCLRYVDFSEHNPSPRVLTVQDLNKIMSSHCIFARKFDERVDSEVIKLIVKKVANKSYVTINK